MLLNPLDTIWLPYSKKNVSTKILTKLFLSKLFFQNNFSTTSRHDWLKFISQSTSQNTNKHNFFHKLFSQKHQLPKRDWSGPWKRIQTSGSTRSDNLNSKEYHFICPIGLSKLYYIYIFVAQMSWKFSTIWYFSSPALCESINWPIDILLSYRTVTSPGISMNISCDIRSHCYIFFPFQCSRVALGSKNKDIIPCIRC